MRGLFVASVVLIATIARGEIIDRISVRVGTRMITASEVNLRVRLTAFEDGEKPTLTLERRKKAAEQLIEQRLVEREMEIGHYPRLNPSEASELLAAFVNQRFGGNAAALGNELNQYGITPAELEADLARQQDLISFLGLRFRLGTDSTKADAEMDTWLKEQRRRTGIEYVEEELAP
jgi:hypothetical protein